MLRLSEDQRDELRAHARAALPHEACGLLVGRETAEGFVVDAVRALRNRSQEPDRYELDPAEHLAVEREAEATGRIVVGAWHSHPDGEPVPSRADLESAWPGWSYLIVAVSSEGRTGCASWRLEGGRFVREPLG